MIGKALTSLGLFGLAGLMVHYKVDPCGLGLMVIICLCVIWDNKEKKPETE